MNAQIILSYTSTRVETNSFENSCSVQKRLIINCFWFQWVLKLWGQIHVKMVSVAEEIHMKLHENKEAWVFVVKLLQKADRHMKQKRNALSSSCWCERVHALEMLQMSFDVWTLRVVNFWCELTNAPEERNCYNWRWTDDENDRWLCGIIREHLRFNVTDLEIINNRKIVPWFSKNYRLYNRQRVSESHHEGRDVSRMTSLRFRLLPFHTHQF